MRTTRLAALGLAFTLFLGACAGDSDKKSSADKPATEGKATADVTVKDFVFDAKSVTVKTGGTVNWTNKDEFDHSIQIDSLDLEGPKFGPQTMPVSYSYRFTKPGTYEYICGVHNSMTGTVIVTD